MARSECRASRVDVLYFHKPLAPSWAKEWLGHGKFAICFFCSEILKTKAQGVPVDEFRTAQWKESRGVSAGNKGSVVMPSQAPHPAAAKLFVNWLLSREGQIAVQRAGNTPDNSEESLRNDIPKDMVRAEVRRIDGVKYMRSLMPDAAYRDRDYAWKY